MKLQHFWQNFSNLRAHLKFTYGTLSLGGAKHPKQSIYTTGRNGPPKDHRSGCEKADSKTVLIKFPPHENVNRDSLSDVPLMQNDLIESHQRRSKSNKARNSPRILGISNHAASEASESETTRAEPVVTADFSRKIYKWNDGDVPIDF